MFSKLKSIKDLREQAKQLQNSLAQETVTKSALSDKIKMTVNGNQELISIEIDPTILDPSYKSIIEDAIIETFNSSIKEVQKQAALKAQQSGMFDMPM